MTEPRLKCKVKGCKRPYTDVSRFGQNVICLFHQQKFLAQIKLVEDQKAINLAKRKDRVRNKEAREIAEEACGFVKPPPVRKYARTKVSEISGGLPFLGKKQ